MKKKTLLTSIMAVATLSLVLAGCGNDAALNEEEAATVETETTTNAEALEETGSGLVYGTVNLTYAEFYYGELNDVEPELDATAGQYDEASKVEAAGYEDEGMYDAVTSATNQKSTKFAATYYEEAGEGVNILGVANVNVAISKALYEDVQNAITNGTVCNNELVELVSNMTVADAEPVEYKVINSDGTVSKTVGETVTADNVTASFTSISTWGNYQFSFDGLDFEADNVIGAIIETADGAKYGLEHEDNLWLKAGEVSFCVEPFTEAHGNEVAYQRFADMQGKTIVKITYMLANAADIEIPVNAYVNLQLDEGYTATSDTDVTYSSEGTVISYALNVPEDSAFALSGIKFGRSQADISEVEVTDEAITLPASFLPGTYTLLFEDATYSGLTATVNVDSGLVAGDVEFDGETFVITKDCGLTGADYISNFDSITVNGEAVSAKGLASILFDENGKLNINAEVEGKESTTPVFADGENTVVVSSKGFPDVEFSVTK